MGDPSCCGTCGMSFCDCDRPLEGASGQKIGECVVWLCLRCGGCDGTCDDWQVWYDEGKRLDPNWEPIIPGEQEP